MYNNGLADYFVYLKPVCKKYIECVAVIFKQRGHISGVMRMFAITRVVMCHCTRKRVIAVTAAHITLVNMKSEYTITTF